MGLLEKYIQRTQIWYKIKSKRIFNFSTFYFFIENFV